MASKRQRLNISSSSFAELRWDNIRFVGEEMWKKFNQTFAKWSLVLERGLRLDDRKDGHMMVMILEKKWVHFTKQLEATIISVVRKFYATSMLRVLLQLEFGGMRCHLTVRQSTSYSIRLIMMARTTWSPDFAIMIWIWSGGFASPRQSG